MKNIKLVISYDGSKFSGFQRQPDQRTVQGDLENAIKQVTGETVNIIPCGRTDTGVHAIMHVLNFFTESDLPGNSFKYKLEQLIEDDIYIIESDEVDQDFHSRFGCKQKTYRYIVHNGPYLLPFYRDYKVHVKAPLDICKMEEGAKKLLGRHDFTAFMKWGEDKNPVRTIDDIKIYRAGDDIHFEFKAESFLHNQIRITVGLLIDIGRGFREPEYIDSIFAGKVERAAKTYGPQGLYLLDIIY